MRTVLANGCFDGLHIGHLIHLKAAKKMGDRLIVSITNDESVKREKGWGRPLFNQEERAEFVKQLRFVDEVIIVSGVREAIQLVKPTILVKGPDYNRQSIDDDTMHLCNFQWIDIKFTEGPKFSSTALLSQLYK